MYTPSKEICEPFILKKENIERIIEIIHSHKPSNQLDKYEPIFRYVRLDDYERLTTDKNDIFNEDNCGDTRISKVEIKNKSFDTTEECDLNYNIIFTSYEDKNSFYSSFNYFKSIKYQVKGENRDEAELLFGKIDKYIFNSVIAKKHRGFIKLSRTFRPLNILPLFLTVMMAIMFVTTFKTSNSNDKNVLIEKAIVNSSITDKLDTLLQIHEETLITKNMEYFIVSSIILLSVFFVVFLIFTSSKVKRKLASMLPFVFDFGISPDNYELRFKSFKFLVGCVITLALGVLGNFLYGVLFK